MAKQICGWCFLISLFFAGTASADQAESNRVSSEKPTNLNKKSKTNTNTAQLTPKSFSISLAQMRDQPRMSQKIVEKEAGSDNEAEAWFNLGVGFESQGNFDSSAKSFLNCRLLVKTSNDKSELGSLCLLGIARIARFSKASGNLPKLYEMRNDKLGSKNIRVQFYSELINSFSFKREFLEAKKLVAETESTLGKLSPSDQYVLNYSQAFMLIDAKDLTAAEKIIKKTRLEAKKMGPSMEAWVDHMDGNYYLAKKDFKSAKVSYQKAVKLIGKKEFQFNAFWVHYLGLKVGFFLGDQNLISSSLKDCTDLIAGTEIASTFTTLINVWAKIDKQEDISADLLALDKTLGPQNNLSRELSDAKNWKKGN